MLSKEQTLRCSGGLYFAFEPLQLRRRMVEDGIDGVGVALLSTASPDVASGVIDAGGLVRERQIEHLLIGEMKCIEYGETGPFQ